MAPFDGAKLILRIGGALAVLRRDDRPDIPWPGLLDLPGGGREGCESPQACVLRELREELGLVLDPAQLAPAGMRVRDGRRFYYFAATLPAEARARIELGAEGQGWALMPPEAFIAAPDAIPHLRDVVRAALAGDLAKG